jgi:hypothetical protein
VGAADRNAWRKEARATVKQPTAKASITKATLTVIGVDMNCPLCGTLVPSGYTHECARDGGITEVRTRKTDTISGKKKAR